jgi:hypothetical protein
MRLTRPRGLVALLLAALAGGGLGAVERAWADHTGTLQLNDRVGPYVVMAWTEPREPRTDACRVTATVLRPGTYRPVADATVRVAARRADGTGTAPPLTATRDRDPAGISQSVDLALPAPGRWTVTVQVSGPDGSGSAEFPLDVRSPVRGWWPVAAAAALAVVVAAAWLLRQRARSRPRRSAT